MQRCVLNLKSEQAKCAVLPALVQSNNMHFFLRYFCNFAMKKAGFSQQNMTDFPFQRSE